VRDLVRADGIAEKVGKLHRVVTPTGFSRVTILRIALATITPSSRAAKPPRLPTTTSCCVVRSHSIAPSCDLIVVGGALPYS
jgi:hypothetical protein